MPEFTLIILALLFAACVTYCAIAAYLSRGIHNQYQVRDDLPDLSIVIPVRNEEEQIRGVLDSLLEADYPVERLEILVINDQSTDRTREIALSYEGRFRCRFEVHDVVDEPDGKLILKTRPLAQGLDRAVGEVALMTDADCVVPPQWARTMARFFTADVGMVCGTTLPDFMRDAVWPLTLFETLDWLFLLGASAGLSGTGQPQALIGNNFSVRLEAYRAIGTYRALEFTDIDDLALMEGIKASGRWRVVFPADRGVMVYTRPLHSLGQLIRQRRRWMKGVSHVGWWGRFVIGFGVLTHVTWPLWPILLGPWFVLPFAFLMLGDGVVLARMLRKYRRPKLMWLVPLYPVFACCYGLGLVALLLTSRRVEWKARHF